MRYAMQCNAQAVSGLADKALITDRREVTANAATFRNVISQNQLAPWRIAMASLIETVYYPNHY